MASVLLGPEANLIITLDNNFLMLKIVGQVHLQIRAAFASKLHVIYLAS